MLETTIPAGRQPDSLVRQTLVDIFDRVDDRRDDPRIDLKPTIARAERCVDLDDADGLVDALLDMAAGAHATIVRVRAALPEEASP